MKGENEVTRRFFHKMLYGYQIKEDEVSGACSRSDKDGKQMKNVVLEPEGKRPLEKTWSKGNIILRCYLDKLSLKL